ncbi:MAG: hypothetical protein IJ560_01855 [Alphaproteobacteria bacterium]|nr:hypothetical protein [Alphaproteobacteria bacterium]
MFGKVKKVFFTGIFGILYVGFVAQLIYVLGWAGDCESTMIGLGMLSAEWFVLIAARYLSKRSSGNAQHGNNFRRR